ncbi:MAG: MurT ligase domain-containing protein, partial [Candidatus Dojkabacteria bacterium]
MLQILGLKILTFVLRTFTRNSATALPGLIMERYFSKILRRLCNSFEHVIFITGTNGKTTTTRLLCHLLEESGIEYVTNPSGSNMLRGIASVLVEKANILGKIPEKYAIFEVEEATAPKLAEFLKPDCIVVTNLFRDQLDAYGEIDTTQRYLQQAIEKSNNPGLVLNGDDYRVSTLASSSAGQVTYITFDKEYTSYIKFEIPHDPERGYLKPELQKGKNTITFTIKNIRVNSDLENTFDLIGTDKNGYNEIVMKVPGMFSTFNAAAALLTYQNMCARSKGSLQAEILEKVSTFKPVFGRGEVIKYGKTRFQILLVKNPAGMNLNLHLLTPAPQKEAILFILNDKIADGRDVSWIWDCDFNVLKQLGFENVFCAGDRRWDMTLRVSYEGMSVRKTFESLDEAVKAIEYLGLKKVYVLATYTSMRNFRDTMSEL